MKKIIQLLILSLFWSCQDNNVTSDASQKNLSDAEIKVQTKAAEAASTSEFAPFPGHPIYNILRSGDHIQQMDYFREVYEVSDAKHREFILGSLMRSLLSSQEFIASVESSQLSLFLKVYFEVPIGNPSLLIQLVEVIENSNNVSATSLETMLKENSDFINRMHNSVEKMPPGYTESNTELNIRALQLSDVKARYNIE
jgi:hypothetical protein